MGFLQTVNHGIPEDLEERLSAAATPLRGIRGAPPTANPARCRTAPENLFEVENGPMCVCASVPTRFILFPQKSQSSHIL